MADEIKQPIEWRSIGIGGGGWFTTVAIDTLNPGTVYVGSDVGGFYKSTDYGLSWQILNNGLTDYYVEKILPDPIHSGVIYLGTWGGIHKSTDGGHTWVPKRNGFPPPSRSYYTAPIGALALDPVNPNIIYAGIGMPRLGYRDTLRWRQVRIKGAIFKSTDAGETWQMLRGTTGIDTTALFYSLAVDPNNSNIIFAGTHLGVYRSTDGGLTWQLKNSGLPPMPDSVVVREIAIDPFQPGRVYVATAPDSDIARNSHCSGIWVTTNYGEVWQACTTGAVRNNFRRIIVNPKNPAVLYAGALYGARAGVYKSTNYGQSWLRITNDNNVYRGWIYFWGYSPDGLAIDNSDTSIIFYTNSHAVMKTTDAGENWWYCYTRPYPGDSTWQTTGLEVTCIRQIVPDPVDSNIIYIALHDVGLLKSTDRGISFRYLHGQMYPYGNTTFALAIHPANHQILYAGTGPWTSIYGKLWRSTDGGENWALLSGLPDSGHKSTILIDPNSREDSTILYVWVSRFGVYKSIDGGQTWERKDNGLNITMRSDSFSHNHPQMLAMDINNPNILYLCLPKRGKVYKTTNGGENWFELPLPRRLLEPWGISVSPLNGAVFLITRASSYGGVYRSFDGGLNWDSLPAFRLDGYRPAVRTIAFSPFDTNLVALGTISWALYDSSTGLGVYLSTDQGETWWEANEGLGNLRIFYLTFDPHNPKILYLGTMGNGVFVGRLITSSIDNAKIKKGKYILLNISPNIVKTQTKIKISLLKPTNINLAIYDALGKKVANLIKQTLSPGEYYFFWPSNFEEAFLLNRGVYFLILNTDKEIFKRKLILIR